MVDTYGRLAKDQYFVPRQVDQSCRGHTWYYVSRIDGFAVFNETKSIHELHFSDGSGPILEMRHDIFLGDCIPDLMVSSSLDNAQMWQAMNMTDYTSRSQENHGRNS